MKIQLKQLTLVNFKGIRNKTILLNPDGDSFIFGNNATGKTTIFDAFTWLLFGKDSAGRSDFEIKTLDETGQAIEKLDHEVTGLLLIDGKEVEIKRIFREKWVKKRGAEVTEFEGNETLLSVNDVPKKANEFKDYINSIINEGLFKLVTTPTAFNALKWEERRKILTDICGAVSSDEVIASMNIDSDRKQWLLNMLASDKSMVDHKKEIAAKVKALKDEIKTIPTRIDEVERSKPDMTEVSETIKGREASVIDKIIHGHTAEINSIDLQIADKSKAADAEIHKVNEKKKLLIKLEGEIEARQKQIKSEVDAEIAERNKVPAKLRTETNTILDSITSNQALASRKHNEWKSIEQQIAKLQKQIVDKRGEWAAVDASEFVYDPIDCACPVCKQPYANIDKKIETLKANFNTDKSNKLEAINSQGAALKSKLESLQKELAKIESDSDAIKENNALLTAQYQEKLTELNAAIQNANSGKSAEQLISEKKAIDIELINFESQRVALQQEIYTMSENIGTVDNSELIKKKSEINAEIDRLKAIQNKVAEVDKANKRIEELKAQEKQLAHTQAQIERDEFLLNKFTRANIEQIEHKVNSMFEIVRFKMFEQQINGGESETCVCTVNGVSYPDLNNAMKIQAGLDIIKTLSRYYKLSAPIFIDNRESIVNIGQQDAQVINLVVSEMDKELRVI